MTPAQLDEARAIYGKEAVDAELAAIQRAFQKDASERKDSSRGLSADEITKWQAEDSARIAADPKVQARAKQDAELLVSSAKISTNHADNYRIRKQLNEMLSDMQAKGLSWTKILVALQDHYNSVSSSSIR